MSKRACILWHLLPFPLALVVLAHPARAQNSGAISGQVIDSTAQQPLVGAEIALLGDGGALLRGVRTDASGRFVLANVPPGTQRVRARFVGYAPKELSLTVRDGLTSRIDFALMPRSLQLDQVVITGTGGVVQKRAVGNVVESISASDVLQYAPARTVDQLVGARTPGVIVLPSSGQVGTGAQIRIRGASSLSLSNDPIVYIDGVRMNSDPAQGIANRGSTGASRLNDINPEDIESIEIIKGPAAATLYGTEASNGVVQIITKRGRSGQAHWDFSTRQGTNWLANPGGRAGLLYGKIPASGVNPCTDAGCTLFNSTCAGVACQIVGFNLYQHDIETGHKPVFDNGRNQGYIASLNGGTDANRYYLSGAYDDDVGIVSWNWDKKFAGRANVDVQANDKLRLQGSLGYIRDRARLAQLGTINVDPFSQLVWGTPLTANTVKRGFSNTPPEEWPTIENHADNDRTTVSLTGTFNPFSWLSNRLVAGLDVNAENNWQLYPRQPLGSDDPLGSDALGNKDVRRTAQNFLTLDYAGSAKYNFRDLDFTTAVGLQHYRTETSTIRATATTFPATPITTVSGGATTGATETYLANATVGMYVQEEAAWKNRLFLIAALRGDDNSTFGKDFKAAYYPKVSGSWVISEEPWFHVPFMSELRLRAALGAAGTQPGAFDAQRLYDPSVGYLNLPGLVPGSFGNPELRPERSRELETGFETSLLGGRADISYTHYKRKVTDAIVNVPLPPSTGFPGNQIINIGRMRVWGDELGVNARVFQGRRVSWELGTQLANNLNRIEDMGDAKFLTVGGGGQAQNRVGFGIGDFFLFKVRSVTLDSKGKVTSAMCDGGTGKAGLEQGGPDVDCATAPRVYWGHSQPTWQMGFNTTVTLYQNLRLYARVDGNGGHLQSDTEIRALHNQGSTLAVIQQNDPFLQEYRAIEADAPGTYEAGFLRFRELSATYTVPPRFVSRVGASGASISLAGRNLSMLWTAQHGWNTSRDGEIYVDVANQHVWDPEIRAIGDLSNGYQTILPPTASFTTTLRLTF